MIFDFIFSFAFLASIAKGYIKGLSKTIFNFIILIAAVIITFSLFNTIGDVFLQSKVGSNLSNEISKEVDAIICEHKDKPENMPYLSSMIKLVSNDEDTFDLANLSDELAVKTVKTLIMIPFCITLIILANVVFILFRKFISKLPGYSVISGIDRFLGLICGTVQGIVLVGVIFVAVSFLQFIPSGNFLNEQFNSSAIVILINDLLF